MLKKITKVKHFGSFKNFTWDETICEFKKQNIFYGWNYSGKTTLSRLFRCLEKKELLEDDGFKDGEFKILLEGDEEITQKNFLTKNLAIRVFNQDFIDDNIAFKESEAHFILIAGDEKIELKEKLEQQEKERKKLNELLTKINHKHKGLQKDISEALTNKAGEVRRQLALQQSEYNINHFKSIVDSNEVSLLQIINNLQAGDDFKNATATYKNKDKKNNITPINKAVLQGASLHAEAKNILQERVSVTKHINKLKDNPRLGEWVRQGFSLHEHREGVKCAFCDNDLTEMRLKELDQHFSESFSKFQNKADDLLKKINSEKYQLENIPLMDSSSFYQEFVDSYNKYKENIKNNIVLYKNNLQSLYSKIEKKKQNPFQESSDGVDELEDFASIIAQDLTNINTLIEKHKSKNNNYERDLTEAKAYIEKYLAAQFIRDEDYYHKKNIITKFETRCIKKLESVIGILDEDIKAIESRIKPEAKGADKLNEYIKYFFNNDFIKIGLTKDGYQIIRDNKQAKWLSEGEKNVIAFAYFMTTLFDTKTKLSETIAFIDDPISSLDSNHVYAVYSFINKHLEDVKQLFISTHNFNFFSLARELGNEKERQLYLIEKNQTTSSIKNLPEVLRKNKSEFIYLFLLINEFLNKKDEFDMIFYIGNIIRRFLDIYCNSHYLNKNDNLYKRIGKLIDDAAQADRVTKFINEVSHSVSGATSNNGFPHLEEAKNVCNIIIEAIKIKNTKYYEDLCSNLSSTPTAIV